MALAEAEGGEIPRSAGSSWGWGSGGSPPDSVGNQLKLGTLLDGLFHVVSLVFVVQDPGE